MSKSATYVIAIGIGALFIYLGIQAEPISGTLGIVVGSLFLLASIVGWTKSSSGS